MTTRLTVGLAISLIALAGGCSDDDDSGGGDGGSAGSSGASGSAGSGGSAAAGGSSAGGSAGTISTGGTAGSTSSGGSAGSAGNATGGAGGSTGGAGGSTGGTGGSSGGGPTGSVQCESKSCDLKTQICCALYNQPDQCIAPGADCFPGVDVACDGPEDCASGQVCCGQMFVQGQNKSYETFACAATCAGSDQRVICGSSAMCPAGKSCGPSELLAQYNDCK